MAVKLFTKNLSLLQEIPEFQLFHPPLKHRISSPKRTKKRQKFKINMKN